MIRTVDLPHRVLADLEPDIEAEPLTHDLAIPLVLDLDGTLLLTDSLHESFFLFLKSDPLQAWRIPGWILGGRARVKQNLAGVVKEIDTRHFPAHSDLVSYATREAERGRQVVLATAADRAIAQRFMDRFTFIAQVIASDGNVNLKGETKAVALAERFPDGFIYAGDSRADMHVWRKAVGAIYVGNSSAIARDIAAVTALIAVFPLSSPDFHTLRHGLRLHQWAKNALIFVPLILSGKVRDPASWVHALAAFVALGALASGTYLCNDLWDLRDDRRHWSKRLRPLASGHLRIHHAVMLSMLGVVVALGIGVWLGPLSLLMLALYLCLSLAYSFRLKREPIVDVLVLAVMFTMRMALGVTATGLEFSPWLFVFSMFIFLSLSLAKRQTEICRMIEHRREDSLGRGYCVSDGPLVLAMGVGTMMATVLVMVIYLVEEAFPAGFYRQPLFLWGFPVTIYLWMSRIWLLCHRGELSDDPVAFAIKDPLSLAYGAAMVVLFILAVL